LQEETFLQAGKRPKMAEFAPGLIFGGRVVINSRVTSKTPLGGDFLKMALQGKCSKQDELGAGWKFGKERRGHGEPGAK